MLSSRKQDNVDKAVAILKNKGLDVSGVVCHVANKEHRQRLIEKVYSRDIWQRNSKKVILCTVVNFYLFQKNCISSNNIDNTGQPVLKATSE